MALRGLSLLDPTSGDASRLSVSGAPAEALGAIPQFTGPCLAGHFPSCCHRKSIRGTYQGPATPPRAQAMESASTLGLRTLSPRLRPLDGGQLFEDRRPSRLAHRRLAANDRNRRGRRRRRRRGRSGHRCRRRRGSWRRSACREERGNHKCNQRRVTQLPAAGYFFDAGHQVSPQLRESYNMTIVKQLTATKR